MRAARLGIDIFPRGVPRLAMAALAMTLVIGGCSQAPQLEKASDEAVTEAPVATPEEAVPDETAVDVTGDGDSGGVSGGAVGTGEPSPGPSAPKKSARAADREPASSASESRDYRYIPPPEAAQPDTTRGLEPKPPEFPGVPRQFEDPRSRDATAERTADDTLAGLREEAERRREESAGAAPEPIIVSPAPTEQPTAEPEPEPAEAASAEEADEKKEPFQVVPVFYGTDRAEEANKDRVSYGSERSHVLKLGKADVTVPLIHKAPKIERPWLIEIPYFKVKIYEQAEDPAKHFTIQNIKAMSRTDLLAEVKDILGQSKTFKDHAFVFVHGFNTSFDNALYRTAQISYDMKFDGAAFVYSWPSGGNVASYTYDSGSVEQAEPHLTNFLNMVIKESGATSVSLIAHSMGNELLLRVLEDLDPDVPDGVQISQIIFAAPDVDRDKFRILTKGVSDFASGVTLYAAANDRALGYSAKFWGGVPRAGDVPDGGPIIVPGVDTVDVTSVSTDSLGLNHSGYAENRALLDDIKQLLLTGTRPPDKRTPPIPKITSEAGSYWRFAPAN